MVPSCLARLARASLLWCIVEVNIKTVAEASLDSPPFSYITRPFLQFFPIPFVRLLGAHDVQQLLTNALRDPFNVGIDPGFFCSNRYGFVEFDDPRDADDAVYDLNGKELCGERVIVEHTKGPRRDGGYGGSGGGGGRSKCPTGCLISHDIHCSDSVSLRGESFLRLSLVACVHSKKSFAEGHQIMYTH